VRDFFGNLSEGISQAITAVAYTLPWLLVVIPGVVFGAVFVEAARTLGIKRENGFFALSGIRVCPRSGSRAVAENRLRSARSQHRRRVPQ
jgi:hypothetical protein